MVWVEWREWCGCGKTDVSGEQAITGLSHSNVSKDKILHFKNTFIIIITGKVCSTVSGSVAGCEIWQTSPSVCLHPTTGYLFST